MDIKTSNKINKEFLQDNLKKVFGFNNFRGKQEEIILNLLSGNDSMVIMPTGGGKSMCYQLPALLSEGVAIVISPLIALMKNQVDALRGYSENDSIAHVLNSSLSKTQSNQVKEDIEKGKTKLVYVAPESLIKEENIAFFNKNKISFFAIDEAHCISEWGHDFRPEYRKLRQIINNIASVPVIALTATATPKVRLDIMKNLKIENATLYLDSFNRKNLFYEIRPKVDIAKQLIKYINERRIQLGGFIPERTTYAKPVKAPPKDIFDNMKVSTGEKEMSTTMALVRMLTNLLRDKNVAPKLVPIIPDEARTFGMEGFFQKIGIYAHEGQKYEPEDSAQLSSYKEEKSGQVLEEGINEAGAMSSWIAAGTSYTNHDIEMIPIYLFYSMFGFQRIGDFAWAGADSQSRGFLIGATAGRTTLAGEGLQHQDGHSHLMASTIPNCRSYDPTFHYELAVIFREGLRRMHEKKENIFYYITTMNENYPHPEMPKDKSCEDGILKGMYKIKEFNKYKKTKIQFLGSGTILREMIAGAEILQNEYQIDSEIWSVTSFNELRRDGLEVERYNLLNPDKEPKKSYVEKCLGNTEGPILAASDYMRMNSDQIRPYVNKSFYSLGTDGFGRSDTRKKLRKFFEVDKEHITTYGLSILAKEQLIASKYAKEAIKKYKIDIDKPMPTKL